MVANAGRAGEHSRRRRARQHSEPEGRGAAWTEERATKKRATREGGASTAPRRRARQHSEPEGRGAAWTEQRATKKRATREGGASTAPRRRARQQSEPECRKSAPNPSRDNTASWPAFIR